MVNQHYKEGNWVTAEYFCFVSLSAYENFYGISVKANVGFDSLCN